MLMYRFWDLTSLYRECELIKFMRIVCWNAILLQNTLKSSVLNQKLYFE